MSLERAKKYATGELERPIETLRKAISATQAKNLGSMSLCKSVPVDSALCMQAGLQRHSGPHAEGGGLSGVPGARCEP